LANRIPSGKISTYLQSGCITYLSTKTNGIIWQKDLYPYGFRSY
jgi:hypothetical protein